VVITLAAIIGPFVLWGERFDATLSMAGARAWMEGWGAWAWGAGVLLLVADIALPIPSTVVMSALGWLLGWWWGGLAAAAGSWLAGAVAYWACRGMGQGAARWIAGDEGMAKAEAMFAKHGGWLVAMSRWMPVLPEAVACMAGVVRMPWRSYALALLCGALPVGFAFAAIGHLGQTEPLWATVLSALVPVALYGVSLWWRRR
jgi:uncharacterized membrane protein YdjX (TVP38/TMEM64 family)